MTRQCSEHGCYRVVQQNGKCGRHNTLDRKALEDIARTLLALVEIKYGNLDRDVNVVITRARVLLRGGR